MAGPTPIDAALPWLAAADPALLRRIALLFTLPVVAWCGRQSYRGAWSALRHRGADRIAGIFVPAVIAVACIAFALWLALGPAPRLAP